MPQAGAVKWPATGSPAAVQAREGELEQAKQALQEAIRLAHEEGIPITRIAKEAGLSRQWVSQIVRDG